MWFVCDADKRPSVLYPTHRGEKVNATIKRSNAVKERSFLACERRAWRALWRRWHVNWAHVADVGEFGHREMEKSIPDGEDCREARKL